MNQRLSPNTWHLWVWDARQMSLTRSRVRSPFLPAISILPSQRSSQIAPQPQHRPLIHSSCMGQSSVYNNPNHAIWTPASQVLITSNRGSGPILKAASWSSGIMWPILVGWCHLVLRGRGLAPVTGCWQEAEVLCGGQQAWLLDKGQCDTIRLGTARWLNNVENISLDLYSRGKLGNLYEFWRCCDSTELNSE